MGVQAIQTAPRAAPKDGGPVLPTDHAACPMVYSAAGHRASFANQVALAAFSHRKAAVHAAIAVFASLLCFSVEAVADESKARGQVFVVPAEQRQDSPWLASAQWLAAVQAMRPERPQQSSLGGTDGVSPEAVTPAQGDELEHARKITEELARELQAEALRAADTRVACPVSRSSDGTIGA